MIVTCPEAEVPDDLGRQVRALHLAAWGDAAPHDPALSPLSLLLVDDGTVLAALDVLHRTIEHAGRRWDAAGLSAVVTAPSARRQGHGLRLVRAARETIAARGADLALFTCDRPLTPFYERAGFDVLPGSVLVGGTPDDPFPSDGPGFDKVVLAALLTADARARHAAFTGARIEVFPGPVDRLW